jgi:hypothetical protein
LGLFVHGDELLIARRRAVNTLFRRGDICATVVAMNGEAQRVGLCFTCEKAKTVETARGSRFYLCTVAELPKYPQLPRRVCPSFVAKPDSTTIG